MDWSDPTMQAAVAAWAGAVVALISTGVTLWLQWWSRPTVQWICDGWGQKSPFPSATVDEYFELHLMVANCGDAAAYAVSTLRNNGGDAKSFSVFEKASVGPGEHFEVIMLATPERFKSCWFEVEYTSSPIRRSRHIQRCRFHPAQELGEEHRFRPGYNPTDYRKDRHRLPGDLRE